MSKYKFLTLRDQDGRVWMILPDDPLSSYVVGARQPTALGTLVAWMLGLAIVCGLVVMAVL